MFSHLLSFLAVNIIYKKKFFTLPEPPKKLLKAFVIPEKRPPFCWAVASETVSVKAANRRRFFILKRWKPLG